MPDLLDLLLLLLIRERVNKRKCATIKSIFGYCRLVEHRTQHQTQDVTSHKYQHMHSTHETIVFLGWFYDIFVWSNEAAGERIFIEASSKITEEKVNKMQ